ncbi:hypothetical protein C8Q74DRAFT_1298881 [Fomes fomentarius]|nr:hypothetical protein C8Q74DRAFT_1298881 [Fomes fomentarius]
MRVLMFDRSIYVLAAGVFAIKPRIAQELSTALSAPSQRQFEYSMLYPIILLGTACAFPFARASATGDIQHPFTAFLPAYRITDCPPHTYKTKFECGAVEVPLDWHNPDLGYTTLSIFRHPTQDVQERRGTIFVHAGLSYLDRDLPLWALNLQLPADDSLKSILGDQYDLVYWTPRDRNLTGLPDKCFEDVPERTGFFKRVFRKELSYVPDWYEDGTVAWDERQSAQDARMLLKAQERMITHCIDKMGPSLFKYVGTAATVRDLAAMADAFDGPNSRINLWVQGHASVVASSLMKMFPERVGKIVMDDPVDPVVSTETAGHLRWIADIKRANETLTVDMNEMATGTANGFSNSSGFVDYDIAISKENAIRMGVELIGWRNRFDAENMAAVSKELQSSSGYADLNEVRILGHRGVTLSRHGPWWDSPLGLSGMPLVCGDQLAEQPETIASDMPDAVAAILADHLGSAPTITSRAFPPLRYLCHLWPIHAVERISLRPPYTADLAQNVLVVLHKKDYWRYFTVSESEARQAWPDAKIISDMPYGNLVWYHDQCQVDIIRDFFHHGESPDSLHPCQSTQNQ